MSRHCTLDPLKDRVLRHGSHCSRNFLALSDENQTGNALNTETGGQRRLRLRVQRDATDSELCLQECQQVGVDRVGLRRRHAVRLLPEFDREDVIELQ